MGDPSAVMATTGESTSGITVMSPSVTVTATSAEGTALALDSTVTTCAVDQFYGVNFRLMGLTVRCVPAVPDTEPSRPP